MRAIDKRKLDLKIVPALIPASVGIAVSLLIIGKHLNILIGSLIAGYFAFLLASILVELISTLKRRKR